MNYELAKKLKDAGLNFEYPQTRENTHSYLDASGNPCGPLGREAAYIPTIFELLKACEGDLHMITLTLSNIEKECVIKTRAVSNVFVDSEEEELVTGEGDSIEESLAELWIALNCKRMHNTHMQNTTNNEEKLTVEDVTKIDQENFNKDLKELLGKYSVGLEPAIRYTPNGIFPILNVIVVDSSGNPVPEEKAQ